MNTAFIICPSYSGSTLLSMLLAHHPKLSTLGEFLDNRMQRHLGGEGVFYCSCGTELEKCKYLTDLTREIQSQGLDFSINFPDLSFRSKHRIAGQLLRAYVRPFWFEQLRATAVALVPAARQELVRVIDRNRIVLSTIMQKDNTSIYLDSAKNNNRVIFFQRYAKDFSVKVIWLKRDGRGVCNSFMNHFGIGMEEAIRRWSLATVSAADTARCLPASNVLTMHYEDLCRDPHGKLDEVCRFLDLDPSLMPKEFSGEGLHLTGNNMRLKGLSEIRQDTKWKKALTAADLRLFDQTGKKLNYKIGYSD